MDYIKLELFKISKKITEVNYKLDLLAKMKIHLIQYIAILKLVYGNYKPLLYEADTYRGQEEDK